MQGWKGGLCKAESPLRQVFGPVLACRTFESEEEAVHIANKSDYGEPLFLAQTVDRVGIFRYRAPRVSSVTLSTLGSGFASR